MAIERKIHVVIVAAGSGSRFGADMPKQYCLLSGRPLLMTTIEAFTDVLGSEAVTLVISRDMEDYWAQLCRDHAFTSPRIAYGGATRSDSVAKALEAIDDGGDPGAIVMVHDGARPLVSKSLIERMMHIPEGYDGAVPAVAVTDTLREVLPGGQSVPADRSRLRAVQTPQTFPLGLLRRAYSMRRAGAATDDATLLERVIAGSRIAIAEGDPANIKVTNPLDIAVAEALLAARRC